MSIQNENESAGSTAGEEARGKSTAVRCWVLALMRVMEEENLTKGEVAKRVGRAQQHIGKILADPDGANPSVRLMEEVALKIGCVELDKFLAFGEELDAGIISSIKERREIKAPVVLGLAKDGSLETSLAVDGVIKSSEAFYEANGWCPGSVVVYYMEGDTLYPPFSPGTRMLVDTDDREPKDGAFYLIRFWGSLAVRRISIDEEGITLHASNPTVGSVRPAAVGLGAEGLFEIFGRVVDARMKM